MKCTYNVNLRHVIATIVGSGKAISVIHYECVCSPTCPSCSAHAPYCHMWPVRLFNIFPHFLINGTIFRINKMYWTWNVCLMFIPCIIRRIRRDQQYALIVSLLYSTCWLLHVSAVACHHQGTTTIRHTDHVTTHYMIDHPSDLYFR
jgi:hypothetical protein